MIACYRQARAMGDGRRDALRYAFWSEVHLWTDALDRMPSGAAKGVIIGVPVSIALWCGMVWLVVQLLP